MEGGTTENKASQNAEHLDFLPYLKEKRAQALVGILAEPRGVFHAGGSCMKVLGNTGLWEGHTWS